MLKGVNKHIIEVVDMENEYFEKAILFLRPGHSGSDEGTLRQRAGEYIRTLKYRPRRPFTPWKALAAALGVGVLVLLGFLVLGSLPA